MTIKQIAQKCNVSPATVSRVLNNNSNVKEETRRKILEAIRESNYKNNLFEINNLSDTLAIVIPNIQDLFQSELVKGVINKSKENGYCVLIYDSDQNLQDEIIIVKKLKEQRVCGMLFLKSNEPDDEGVLRGQLEDLSIPIVLIDKELPGIDLDGVFIENVAGGYNLAEILLKNNPDDVLVVSGALESKVAQDRVKGIKKAFKDFKMELPEENILYTHFDDKDIIYDRVKEKIKRKRFKNIISCNNIITLQILKLMKEYEINLGEDVLLIAFDKIEMLESLGIKIQTASVNPMDLGTMACQMLIDRIEKKDQFRYKRKLYLLPEVNKMK